MDDGKSNHFLWEGDASYNDMLIQQNLTDIVNRRQVRWWFRALIDKQVEVKIWRKETHKVPDGYTTNSKGEKQRRYSTVTVDVWYDKGVVSIDSEKISGEENLFSAGFDLEVKSQGLGHAVGPVTGEKSDVHPTHKFKEEELGMKGFTRSQNDFFCKPFNMQIANKNLPLWFKEIVN